MKKPPPPLQLCPKCKRPLIVGHLCTEDEPDNEGFDTTTFERRA